MWKIHFNTLYHYVYCLHGFIYICLGTHGIKIQQSFEWNKTLFFVIDIGDIKKM